MIQLGRRFAEVVAGGGFEAVVAVAEVGQVAVVGQDLLLAQAFLELDGEQGLPDLPAPDLGAVEIERSRHLHGDRRGAREPLAPLPVLQRGARHADDVEAPVGVEVPVLRAQEHALEDFWHLAFGEHDALLDRVAPEDLAPAVQEPGDLAGRQVGDGLHLGQIDRRRDADSQQDARHRRRDDGRDPPPVPQAPGQHGSQGVPRGIHHARIIRPDP